MRWRRSTSGWGSQCPAAAGVGDTSVHENLRGSSSGWHRAHPVGSPASAHGPHCHHVPRRRGRHGWGLGVEGFDHAATERYVEDAIPLRASVGRLVLGVVDEHYTDLTKATTRSGTDPRRNVSRTDWESNGSWARRSLAVSGGVRSRLGYGPRVRIPVRRRAVEPRGETPGHRLSRAFSSVAGAAHRRRTEVRRGDFSRDPLSVHVVDVTPPPPAARIHPHE